MGQGLSLQECAMIAIHDDNVRDLMYYIQKGVDIDGQRGQGLLLYAATQDSVQCAHYLISQGVNPFKKSNGLSFYEYAVQHRDQELLQVAQRWVPQRLHMQRMRMRHVYGR